MTRRYLGIEKKYRGPRREYVRGTVDTLAEEWAYVLGGFAGNRPDGQPRYTTDELASISIDAGLTGVHGYSPMARVAAADVLAERLAVAA